MLDQKESRRGGGRPTNDNALQFETTSGHHLCILRLFRLCQSCRDRRFPYQCLPLQHSQHPFSTFYILHTVSIYKWHFGSDKNVAHPLFSLAFLYILYIFSIRHDIVYTQKATARGSTTAMRTRRRRVSFLPPFISSMVDVVHSDFVGGSYWYRWLDWLGIFRFAFGLAD